MAPAAEQALSGPRLIAVCGFSDGSEDGLHPVCLERLRRGEREARADDVVLLSGWARHGDAGSEAELMAGAWSAPCDRLVVDSDSRSTLANVAAAARLASALDSREVVLVTSGWHARRALALLRRAMRGSNASVRTAVTGERPSSAARARELVCWTLVPFARLV